MIATCGNLSAGAASATAGAGSTACGDDPAGRAAGLSHTIARPPTQPVITRPNSASGMPFKPERPRTLTAG